MLIALLSAIACQPGALLTSFEGSIREYAAKISEGGEVRYSVDAALQDEPILIRSPNLALESPRMRELVAQAVEGEWVETRPNQFRLEIGRATTAKLADKDLRQRTSSLTAWLNELKRTHRVTDKQQVGKLLEELSTYERRAGDGSLVRNQVMSYEPPTPAAELLKALLLGLGPADLAKVSPGETRTWSNVPVGEQERFPPTCQRAIAAYQSASELLASSLGPEDLPKVQSYPWEAFFTSLRRNRSSCRYLLAAAPTFRAPLFRLRVYDQRGELIDLVGLLGPVTVPLNGAATDLDKMPEDRIPLTDSSTEFVRLVVEGELHLNQLTPREPPKAELLASKEFEPLSVGFGELFSNVSGTAARTVVAYLPDAVFEASLSHCKESVLAAMSLWRAIATSGFVEVDQRGDAIVLRPENPVQTRRERVGRSALRRYAQQVLERRGTTPKMDCTFMFEGGPGTTLSPVATAWRKCLVPLVPVRFGQIRYWLGALLGNFGEQLWTELEAGRGVSVRNLPPTQKLALRKWLEFGGPGRYEYEPSVTSSNALYDYQVFFDLADDPLVQCTTRGQGLWGSFPLVPTRLSELIRSLVGSNVKSEELAVVFDGRFDLVSSTAYTAVARLGYVEWARDELGDLTSARTATNVKFADWPEALRTRVLRALEGGGGG